MSYTCLQTKDVPTSPIVKDDSGSGYPLYSVNCKAALGCIETGIGHEQLNNMLVTLNIPPVHHGTMKRAERRVGPAIESTAEDACKAAIAEEKALTIASKESLDMAGLLNSSSIDNPDKEEVELVAQFDFDWDTRGSGRSYSSHSGRGSAIGHFSKKILGVKVMSRMCALCDAGQKPGEHKCSKKYEGSSKGME